MSSPSATSQSNWCFGVHRRFRPMQQSISEFPRPSAETLRGSNAMHDLEFPRLHRNESLQAPAIPKGKLHLECIEPTQAADNERCCHQKLFNPTFAHTCHPSTHPPAHLPTLRPPTRQPTYSPRHPRLSILLRLTFILIFLLFSPPLTPYSPPSSPTPQPLVRFVFPVALPPPPPFRPTCPPAPIRLLASPSILMFHPFLILTIIIIIQIRVRMHCLAMSHLLRVQLYVCRKLRPTNYACSTQRGRSLAVCNGRQRLKAKRDCAARVEG